MWSTVPFFFGALQSIYGGKVGKFILMVMVMERGDAVGM